MDIASFSLSDSIGIAFQLPERGQTGFVRLYEEACSILGTLEAQEIDFFAAAAALVVAGLYRPHGLEIQWNSYAASLPDYRALADMLYEVRAYCEDDDIFLPTLYLSREPDQPNLTPLPTESVTHSCDTLLLFSGGIDSTFSLIQLLEAGAKPMLLCIDMNPDTQSLEREAADRIARHFNVPILFAGLSLKGFPSRGESQVGSDKFGLYPTYNSVPHGREIMSLALACLIARRHGIYNIAVGQEKDSVEKTVQYQGKTIYRHEVESRPGNAIMNSWTRKIMGSENWNIYSPIADKGIDEIRRTMFTEYPHILSMAQSCFWERLCGHCIKCISLYLLQRITGQNVFEFDYNPLDDPDNEDMEEAFEKEEDKEDIGFYGQILQGLQELSEDSMACNEFWVKEYTRVFCQ